MKQKNNNLQTIHKKEALGLLFLYCSFLHINKKLSK
jgi:hypothetical protein